LRLAPDASETEMAVMVVKVDTEVDMVDVAKVADTAEEKVVAMAVAVAVVEDTEKTRTVVVVVAMADTAVNKAGTLKLVDTLKEVDTDRVDIRKQVQDMAKEAMVKVRTDKAVTDRADTVRVVTQAVTELPLRLQAATANLPTVKHTVGTLNKAGTVEISDSATEADTAWLETTVTRIQYFGPQAHIY